jgi:hypothetical protein
VVDARVYRSTAMASSWSRAGPNTPGPASCMAPYPTRRTTLSARRYWLLGVFTVGFLPHCVLIAAFRAAPGGPCARQIADGRTEWSEHSARLHAVKSMEYRN